MDVRLITHSGMEDREVGDLPGLLAAQEGVVWVDVPVLDEAAAEVLTSVFGFHTQAMQDCEQRNHVPKLHTYADHLLLVLHSPEPEPSGHVHYLELDQFVSEHYLVTIHGPLSPAVPLEKAMREARLVERRLRGGRLRPSSGWELSYALVSTLVRTHEAEVGRLARLIGLLEQRVMSSEVNDPEPFLEELFRARHELLVVRTMAVQSREVYGRAVRLTAFAGPEAHRLLDDLLDQYDRVAGLAAGQGEFLQTVIEFHRARTDTKMLVAAERLAVIAAVTLPITALSSVLGMNVIVNTKTRPVELIVLLAIMVAMSAALLRWTRKQGWW
jgi:magnesium transporter